MKITTKVLTFIIGLLFIQAPLSPIYAYGEVLRQDSMKIGYENARFRTTFYVYAPSSQNYDIRFWIMGIEFDSSGGSYTYDYGVDGAFRGTVHPTKSDWHVCTPTNSTVYLTAGSHQIYVEDFYILPNVEAVYSLPPLVSLLLPSYDSEYKRMKQHIHASSYPSMSIDPLLDGYRVLPFHPVDTDSLVAPMHYYAELNREIYYTFCRVDHYFEGRTLNIYTECEDSLKRVVHVFNSDASFSVTSPLMESDFDYFTCTIPNDGYYYVMVRAYNPDEWGTCNLHINNKSFMGVPFSCTRTDIVSPESGKEYANFAVSGNEDPVMFLMGSGNGGGIQKLNDNYSHPLSGYDWGSAARIDGEFVSGQWVLTVPRSFPAYATKTCDIFTRCERRNLTDPLFPNYKVDDFLYSAPNIDCRYNCISWAVGDWVYGYWFPNNATFSTENWNSYVDSVFQAYDLVLTTEARSTVDLWACETAFGKMEYSHASVKNKGHKYAGSYSWESKIAELYRCFHPRYALRYKDGWGDVIKYYRRELNSQKPINDSTIVKPGPYLVNYNFTQSEFDQIETGSRRVRQDIADCFSRLFDECKKEGAMRVTIYIDSYERVEAYRRLLDYCREHLELRSLLYKKICESDILGIKLLKDLTLESDNARLWQEVHDEVQRICSERRDGKCLYNAQTYGALLVKKLLAADGLVPKRLMKADFSNNPALQVINDNGLLQLSFELEADAVVSMHVGSLDGAYIQQLIGQQRMESGIHACQYKVPKPGIYAVGLSVNGAVYKKTLRIE